MKFTKMHGIGNDYVYVNCFEETVKDAPSLAQQVSDRHFGIGSDGLILVCPSDVADAQMRMFNADGSESQMCGNGLRCVAKFTFDRKLAQPGEEFVLPDGTKMPYSLNLETGNGILKVGITTGDDGLAEKVCVNMGEPILRGLDIPVAIDAEKIVAHKILIQDKEYEMTCVSMGNPHAVFFCDSLDDIELEKIGPLVENHSLFPERINAHFVEVNSDNEFTMLTWERGSGVTLACGTGACACIVAAVLNAKCARKAIAHLPGGDLELNWSDVDNCVYMTGPATEVFRGVW